MKALAKMVLALSAIRRRVLRLVLRPLFRRHGRNLVFFPDDLFSYDTISMGDDVYIGPGARFLASETTLTIGSKVLFGPNVSIIAGDHNTSIVGKYMFDVLGKLPENDLPVTIEDDVWVGAGAIF